MAALIRIPPQTRELPLWDEVDGAQVIVGYKTVPAPLFPDGVEPLNLIPTQAQDIYLCAPLPAAMPAGAEVVLEYQEDGTVLQVDLDAYLAIRPFDNDAGGDATDDLRYHHFMGDAQPMFGNPLAADEESRLYPEAHRPLALYVGQKQISGKWRFRAELRGSPPQKFIDLPTKPKIRAYTNPDYTGVIGDTVSFAQGPSLVFQDGDGNAETVWFVNCPVAAGRSTRAPWYLAVVVGTRVLARVTLDDSERFVRKLFWGL